MQIHPGNLFKAAITLVAFGGSVVAQTMPQDFVSVTPCRIADTRTSSGGGGPITGATYRTFPVIGAPGVGGKQACSIPSNAAAFSLNVTAVPPSGSSLLYLSILPAMTETPTTPPSSSTLNDPSGTIIANAALVPSGLDGAVMVYVSDTSDVIIDIDGYFVDQTSASYNTALGTGAGGSTGDHNTAIGFEALNVGTGNENVAVGSEALRNNTYGSFNTAVGDSALASNLSGVLNSAFGHFALNANVAGVENEAFGANALYNNVTGRDDVAIGWQSLNSNVGGNYNVGIGTFALLQVTANGNTGVGYQTLYHATSGTGNIALGYNAGQSVTSGSNNIEIGNQGTSADNGVIRIGTRGSQTTTYVEGILEKLGDRRDSGCC